MLALCCEAGAALGAVVEVVCAIACATAGLNVAAGEGVANGVGVANVTAVPGVGAAEDIGAVAMEPFASGAADAGAPAFVAAGALFA
ncbi:MAG: hypothetical protein WAN39_09825, partial [Candidatus Cybelea sp.]